LSGQWYPAGHDVTHAARDGRGAVPTGTRRLGGVFEVAAMTRLRWSWSAVLAVWLALLQKPAAMVKFRNVTDVDDKINNRARELNISIRELTEQTLSYYHADIDALGALTYEQDGFGPTLEDVRKGLIGKIGENMSFRRFKLFHGETALTSYLHGTRIGVLVEYAGDESAARDVAMHVAAMKPVSLTSADVPAELIERERSVATAKAAESGKPADIAAKMIEGSVQKYLKEVSLFDQPFVKNDKQTVAQMLQSVKTTIKSFTLYVVGEGIERKVDDFAAEVAAQVAAAKQSA
jgi:elongation factor Ts